MKRLSELGVSPAPWTAEIFANDPSSDGRDIMDALGHALANTQPISGKSIADARLIAAAPDMYQALHDAVKYWCCDSCCDAYVLDGDRCAEADGSCRFQRWRKALEKAGGGR